MTLQLKVAEGSDLKRSALLCLWIFNRALEGVYVKISFSLKGRSGQETINTFYFLGAPRVRP